MATLNCTRRQIRMCFQLGITFQETIAVPFLPPPAFFQILTLRCVGTPAWKAVSNVQVNYT